MIAIAGICWSVFGGGIAAYCGQDIAAGLAVGAVLGVVIGLAYDCWAERQRR